jgi:hypothetical protein
MTPTKEQLLAAVMATKAVAESIRELRVVESGKLYAVICGSLDLATYQHIINTLKRIELVREDANHVLTWAGPDIETDNEPQTAAEMETF